MRALCSSFYTNFMCSCSRLTLTEMLQNWATHSFRKRRFSSPQRLGQLRGPPSLLSNGYRGLFPKGQSGRSVNLTTHNHLMPRLRMVELHLLSPTRLDGVVLNQAQRQLYLFVNILQLWNFELSTMFSRMPLDVYECVF
jgi:hypothetical protein